MHKYYEKSENLRIKIKQNEISGVPISPKLAIVPPLDLILIIRRYPYHKRKKNIYIYIYIYILHIIISQEFLKNIYQWKERGA